MPELTLLSNWPVPGIPLAPPASYNAAPARHGSGATAARGEGGRPFMEQSQQTPVSPRLQQLQKLLEREPNDTFLLYGTALEYKKLGDSARALEFLGRVLQLDPGYCYAYHQRGLIHESNGDVEAARQAYREGVAAATDKGDAHAREEIQSALDMLG
jgi:tetratricopeptide (TPR) repeat protein